MFIERFFKICKNRNKELKILLKKGEELLEEEFDILRIIKSIRKFKQEEENKFIIDVDEDNSSTS